MHVDECYRVQFYREEIFRAANRKGCGKWTTCAGVCAGIHITKIFLIPIEIEI